jgi:hypothetical protein
MARPVAKVIDAIAAIRSARPQAFVAYAEDALEWHLVRIGASTAAKQQLRTRLAHWRAENPMDVHRAIRNGGRRDAGLAA